MGEKAMEWRHHIILKTFHCFIILAFLSACVTEDYKLRQDDNGMVMKEKAVLFDADSVSIFSAKKITLFDAERLVVDTNRVALFDANNVLLLVDKILDFYNVGKASVFYADSLRHFDADSLSHFDADSLSHFYADKSETNSQLQSSYSVVHFPSSGNSSQYSLTLIRCKCNQNEGLIEPLELCEFDRGCVFSMIMYALSYYAFYAGNVYYIFNYLISLKNGKLKRFVKNNFSSIDKNSLTELNLNLLRITLRVKIMTCQTHSSPTIFNFRTSKFDSLRKENVISLENFEKIIHNSRLILKNPFSGYLNYKAKDLETNWPLSSSLRVPFRASRRIFQQCILFPALGRLATFRSLLDTPIHQATSFVSLSNAGYYYDGSRSRLVCEGCGGTVDVLDVSRRRNLNRCHADGCRFLHSSEEREVSGTSSDSNISTNEEAIRETEGSFSIGDYNFDEKDNIVEKDNELSENAQISKSLDCPHSENVQLFHDQKDFKDISQMQGLMSSNELKLRLLQKENQSLKAQLICKMCKTTPITNMFLPCGELYACDVCSKELTRCPGCKQKILATATVYLV